MIKVPGSKLSVRMIERHAYICDLLYSEGALLSLFRDRRFNWLYLWVDTDQIGTDRWILFPVSRGELVRYFEKKIVLRDLLLQAKQRWMLDSKGRLQDVDAEENLKARESRRVLVDISQVLVPDEYAPTSDSYFDETLSPDISLAREFNPVGFDVPIDGYWFFSDLDRFSGLYGQLYGFFYCTKPQFVTNLGQRVRRFLRSPWEGGFSRVNLFRALQDLVPSLHDLEIKSIYYASPGKIRIEALNSVAYRIAEVLTAFIESEDPVVDAEKAINKFLASAKLKKRNVSALSNEQLGLTHENIAFLTGKTELIGDALGVNLEMNEIISQSPNIVVSSKVVVALVGRVRKLAEFQHNGQIDIVT